MANMSDGNTLLGEYKNLLGELDPCCHCLLTDNISNRWNMKCNCFFVVKKDGKYKFIRCSILNTKYGFVSHEYVNEFGETNELEDLEWCDLKTTAIKITNEICHVQVELDDNYKAYITATSNLHISDPELSRLVLFYYEDNCSERRQHVQKN